MNRMKKIGKIVLALVLIFTTLTFLPQSTSASNEEREVMYPTTASPYLQNKKLIFGGKGYKKNTQIWDIVNPHETGFGQSSIYLIGRPDAKVPHDDESDVTINNSYAYSRLRGRIETDANSYRKTTFTPKEQAVVMNSKRPAATYGQYMDPSIDGDKWFAPLYSLTNTSYDIENIKNSWFATVDTNSSYPLLYANYTAKKYIPGPRLTGKTVYSYRKGFTPIDPHDGYFPTNFEESPHEVVCFNIGYNDIAFVGRIFQSNPEYNGKPASLSANGVVSTKGTYNLTVKDPTQKLSISDVRDVNVNDVISFDYAITGDGDQIVAIVTDASDQNILYSSVIKHADTERTGTIKLQLPKNFVANNYKLKVFSQKFSYKSETGYVSNPQEVPVKQVTYTMTMNYKDENGNDTVNTKTFLLDQDLSRSIPYVVYSEGYRFDGWEYSTDINLKAADRDFAITAKYTRLWDVRYLVSGSTTYSETVVNGDKVRRIPPGPKIAGQRFVEWQYPEGVDPNYVTKDFDVNASYVKLHDITYKDWDGAVLSTETVDEGKAATKVPNDPRRVGYVFDGWKYTPENADLTNVTQPIEAVAQYTKRWSVRYEDYNGKEIYAETVEDGQALTSVPSNPTRPGYRFDKWVYDIPSGEVNPNKIVKSYTAKASYIQQFNYAFYQKDGKTLAKDKNGNDARGTVDAGTDLRVGDLIPEAPYISGDWHFEKWTYNEGVEDGIALNVTKDFTATASYRYDKEFTVTFEKYDGTILPVKIPDPDNPGTNKEVTEQKILDGGNAVAPNAPKRDYYHFSMWEDYYNIKEDKIGDTAIKGLYLPYKYKISTKRDLYAYTKEDAKDLFGGLATKDKIKEKILDIYAPDVFRDNYKQEFGTEEKPGSGVYNDPVEIIVSDKTLDAIKAGQLGKYEVTLRYENTTATGKNPTDKKAFTDEKRVIIKITDSVTEDKKADQKYGHVIAANDFVISINEVKAFWAPSLIKLSSVQAIDASGIEREVRVGDTTQLKPELGVYPVSFKAEVMEDGVSKEITTTVNVRVKDNTNVDEAPTEQINGNDFTVKKADLGTINGDKDKFIELAQVQAVQMEQGQKVGVTIDTPQIENRLGKQLITYRSVNGTMLTVIVNVVENEVINTANKEKMSGNNFVMKAIAVKELLTLPVDQQRDRLVALGEVKAVDSDTYETVAITKVEISALQPKTGSYTIHYQTAKGTTLPVTVTVKDDTVIDETLRQQISASDFTILTKDAKSSALTNSALITLGNAVATNIDTGEAVAITKVEHDILAKPGDYIVSYQTDKGIKISVVASVRDTMIVKDGQSISGNTIVITTSEAKTLDDNKLKVLSSVKAININTKDPIGLSIKSNDVKAIAGNYTVVFTTGTVDLPIQVIVQDEIISNDRDMEQISASNFMIQTNEVKNLVTDSDVLTIANVKARNIETNEAITDIVIKGKVLERAGEYELTFTTKKGTSVSIVATVIDEVVVNPDEGIRISGNRFVVKTSEVSKLTNGKLITLGNVKASNTATGQNIKVSVESSAIVAVAGVYNVVYKASEATKLTIPVTVQDKVIEDTINKEQLSASHFTVKASDALGLSHDDMKTKAKVQAVNLENNTNVDVADIKVSAQLQQKAGTYPVTFKTAKGTALTVDAYVVDESNENVAAKERITGNHFIVKRSEVEKLNDTKVIQLASAKASNPETGATIPVRVVDRSVIKAIAGTYPVVLTTDVGTSITVIATVQDEMSENTDVKENISASHFKIKTGEVATLDDAAKIIKANVKAYNMETGALINKFTVRGEVLEKPGEYPLTFVTDKMTSVTIHAIVVDEMVHGVQDTISGNHFKIKTSEVATITNEKMIQLGDVQAYSNQTGYLVPIEIDRSALYQKPGVYPVIFKTATGTAITLQVTVSDQIISDEGKREVIIASNFMVKTGDVAGLKTAPAATFIGLANAKAWSLETGKEVAITKVSNDLKEKAGDYDVSFMTDKDTFIMVQAKVYDEIIDNGTTKERMSGNHFTMKTSEVRHLDEQRLIALGNVKAMNMETGEVVAVTVKTNPIQAVAGNYEVVYQTANHSEMTLRVKVQDESIVNAKDQEQMSASNILVKTSDVPTSDIETWLKTKSNLDAIYLDTGNPIVDIETIGTVLPRAGSYPITFASPNQKTKVSIVVEVYDVIEEKNDERISASHAFIKTADVKGLNDDGLRALTKVKASKISTGEELAVQVVNNPLVAKPGVYPVTFATDLGTTVTVNITVSDQSSSDETKKEFILANDFEITVDQVQEIKDKGNEEFIKRADAKAWSTNDGTSIGIETVEQSLEAKAGDYQVTFLTAKKTSVQITVRVCDVSTSNPALHEVISGNHFILKTSEVDSSTSESLIALGNVKAKNVERNVYLNVNVTSTLKAIPGVYDITYSTENGTSIILKATVQDEYSNNDKNKEEISASNFKVSVEQAKTLSVDAIKTKAKVQARNSITGEEIAVSSITMSGSVYPKAGKYPLTFMTPKGSKVSSMVEVYDVEGTVQPGIKESITGNHVYITSDKVAKVQKDQWIELANVQATNLDTGKRVPVTIVENKVEKTPGIYPITFTTKLNSRLTTNIIVSDYINENGETKETMIASDFTILIKDLKNLDKDEIIKRSNAKAWNTVTGESVEITDIETDVKAKEGTYSATLQTANKTSVKIEIAVRDESSTTDKGEKIKGNSFTVVTSEVGQLEEKDYIALGKVEAKDIQTDESREVHVVENKVEAKRGIYPITYGTKAGTILKVEIEVRDNVIHDQDTKESMVGNDIYLGVEHVETITDTLLKQLSKVQAVEEETQAPREIVTVDHNIKNKVGEYWASFATAKGTTLKVRVYVEQQGTINNDNQEMMTGSPFKVAKTDVKTLTPDQWIALGHVKAVDMESGYFVDMTVDSQSVQETEGVYEIHFATEKGTKLTLLATVYDASKVKERIIGNDIYLSIDAAKTVEQEELTSLSRARAMDINSEQPVAITRITNTIKPVKGIYEAAFSTDLGTILVVDVYVNNESNKADKVGQQITGNSFTVKPEEVSKLTEDTIVALGNIKAVDMNTSEFVNVYVDKSALQATEGTYEIPLSTSKETRGKVYAEVKQEAPSIEDALPPTQQETPVIIQKQIIRIKKEQSSIPNHNTTILPKKDDIENKESVKLETVKPITQRQGTTMTNSDDKMQWVVWTIIVSYGCYMVVRIFTKKPKEE